MNGSLFFSLYKRTRFQLFVVRVILQTFVVRLVLHQRVGRKIENAFQRVPYVSGDLRIVARSIPDRDDVLRKAGRNDCAANFVA